MLCGLFVVFRAIRCLVDLSKQETINCDEKALEYDNHCPGCVGGDTGNFDDDDELLASQVINEWMNANPEEFQSGCELALKKVLNQLSSDGAFASLPIMKPYSFVMVDAEKETLAELLIVDEEETMFLSGELLQGLDDELNTFLKDLLEI